MEKLPVLGEVFPGGLSPVSLSPGIGVLTRADTHPSSFLERLRQDWAVLSWDKEGNGTRFPRQLGISLSVLRVTTI